MSRHQYPEGTTMLPGGDYARAQAYRAPPELQFWIAGEPRVVRDGVEVLGVLANPTDQEVLVIGLPVGTGPFYVKVRTQEGVEFWSAVDPDRPKDLPPRPVPAPPPPMEFMVPPRSETVFVGVADLTYLKYQGPLAATLEWTFLFWNGPQPRGTIEVTLPKR